MFFRKDPLPNFILDVYILLSKEKKKNGSALKVYEVWSKKEDETEFLIPAS